MHKIESLAKFLNVGTDEIEQGSYYTESLSCNGEEYLVLTDEEADKLVAEEIRGSLWAFNTDFILEHSVISEYSDQIRVINAFKKLQEELCESANELIYALVEDFDGLVEDAVEADGRGSFLAKYDGHEHDYDGYYIYRVD